MSIKLLIDTVGKRVLFAEAGKDCVDFLLSILSFPLSTVIRLLGKQQMRWSLPNLYKSLETLNESYLLPNITKETLLQPPAPLPGYMCAGSHPFLRYVTDELHATCPCGSSMDTTVKYLPPGGLRRGRSTEGEGGFVTEATTYMVMDDLVVNPMSMMSSISLLAQSDIKNVHLLEEKVVTFGMNEAVKLLKASLVSKKVLTTVFLNN